MGGYFSRTTNDDATDTQPLIAKARVVEHIVARYEDVDNPETHMPYAKVPDEFCLKPKYERGTYELRQVFIGLAYLSRQLRPSTCRNRGSTY